MTVALNSAPRHLVVIPAAGTGSRFANTAANSAVYSAVYSATGPKQYALLAGKPVIEHTVRTFLDCPFIDCVLVVVSEGDPYIQEALGGLQTHPHVKRLSVKSCGGDSRQASVENGLRFLSELHQASGVDWAWVHDAARPGITLTALERLLSAVNGLGRSKGGAILAQRVADTVKRQRVDSQEIESTISREGLWLAQTPQVFRLQALHQALIQAREAGFPVTDEASAMERLGLSIQLVEGEMRNNKVTVAQDLQWLEAVWR